MKKFSKPNLPDNGQILICDKNKYTETLFDNFVPTVKIGVLPTSMQYHADLQICHVGAGVIVSAPECFDYYKNSLEKFGIKVLCGEKEVESTYGGDCAYNVLVIGKYAFHNTKYTDSVIKKYF